ncbi:MAG: hypothetical protein JWN91_2818 [Nocardioides sp.]|jgi:hypothetical protein|nr:hypothetical protein [Nocardioides sp.]
MAHPPSPPAGWHPNPGPEGGQRYWDGVQWTEHYAPGQALARRPSVDQAALLHQRRKMNDRIILIVGAVVATLVVIALVRVSLGG